MCPVDSKGDKCDFGLGLRHRTSHRLTPVISNRTRFFRDYTVRTRPIDLVSTVNKQSTAVSAEMWIAISKMAVRLVGKSGVMSCQAVGLVFLQASERVLCQTTAN